MSFFRKKLFFLAVFLLISTLILAQEKYEGYIILPAGDTIHGSILYPKIDGNVDFTGIHDWIQFADTAWNLKVYKPKELAGFTLIDGPEFGKYESKEVGDKRKFLKRIKDGYWKLFEQEFGEKKRKILQSNPNLPVTTTKNMFREEFQKKYYLDLQTDLIELKQKDGRFVIKQLKEIFKDYPDVLAKLVGDMLPYKFSKILEGFNSSMESSTK